MALIKLGILIISVSIGLSTVDSKRCSPPWRKPVADTTYFDKTYYLAFDNSSTAFYKRGSKESVVTTAKR